MLFAYESKEERTPDGKWKKECKVGGIVILGIVAYLQF